MLDPATNAALPADLQPACLSTLLATKRFGRTYEPYALCGSTNDIAAARAREGAPEGLVVLADRQESGRGRQGRAWLSAGGENLMFSLLLRPQMAAVDLPPITLIAGVAIADALADAGVRPRLKWPNDVLCDTEAGPRKLVGVLTEMATAGAEAKHVIVGIGVNVNQRAFADPIAAIASSVALATGAPADRTRLLATILGHFEAHYDAARAGSMPAILARFRDYAAFPRPCEVLRPQGKLTGVAIDVDEMGALLVRDTKGRIERVLSGEVASL